MGDNIPGESFLDRSFLAWDAPGGNFPRTEYIKCILKCVNTYALLMKFCCKTETLMLQINTNLII